MLTYVCIDSYCITNPISFQTASEDAAGSGNGDKESGPDHPTPSHSSSSPPSTPGSQWRRSQSYEKLDFTDVMPPPPPPRVTTPNRAFKHSTSMVASRQNGSLLEEMGRRLDSPTKTPKKRPTSAVLHPGSAGSVSGTTSGECPNAYIGHLPMADNLYHYVLALCMSLVTCDMNQVSLIE